MGMLGVFSTSSTGMLAQSTALQNISGNIANASTTGYKAVETSFADLIPDEKAGTSASQGTGSVGTTSRLSTALPGTITTSGVSTNMALSGNGYFVVSQNTGTATTPAYGSGSLYTRRGDFSLDKDGYLTNGAGYALTGSAANGGGSATTPIHIAAASASGSTLTSVAVGTSGGITATYADGSTAAVGQVAVAQIEGQESLIDQSGGAYSVASGAKATLGLNGATIQGGALEASNTDISDQFSKMIVTQQAYSFNSKVMSTANEMMQSAINMMS